jgi:hypothetical protein
MIKRLKRGKIIENSILQLEDSARRAFERLLEWVNERDQSKLYDTLTAR